MDKDVNPLVLGGIFVTMFAASSWLANRMLLKANRELADELAAVTDVANRSLYLAAYLAARLAEEGIELTDFDKQVISDPPGIFGGDSPTLFAQMMADPDFLQHLAEGEGEAEA